MYPVTRKRKSPSTGPIVSTADLRCRASRTLPGFVFDFIDGGAEDEVAARRNLDAFTRSTLLPRLGGRLPDDVQTTVLGIGASAPFGVAPMGLADLIYPGADLAIAAAAATFGLPYVCSAASGTALDVIAERNGAAPWFQLYTPRRREVSDGLVQMADRVGAPVLIVTVDVPVPGKRLRDIRNGLQIPVRPTARMLLESARHPRWAVRRALAGPIRFPNFEPFLGDMGTVPFSALMAEQTGGRLDREEIARLRDRWHRKLVLKGVLSGDDVAAAIKIGVDAVVLSNHGGRQLDASPSPLDVLPALRDSFESYPLFLDSGIRKGEDIVKVLAAGGDFAFVGRPFLYALAALGPEGPLAVAEMLIADVKRTIALCGGRQLSDVTWQAIARNPA